MATLRIDRDICTGHGRCYDTAPDLIEPDEEGLGTVTVADVPPSMHDAALRAARSCPERAVTFTEDTED